MTPIYRLNGEYFGYLSAGNIYAGDGTYFGWLDGEHAWYRTGHHLGEIVDDTYILRRAGGRTRTHRAPRTAVNRPGGRKHPDRAAHEAPAGWVDALEDY